MRRLYSPILDDSSSRSSSKLPQRILLIAAMYVMVGLCAFIFVPGAALLFIHFWVYLAVAALIPVLLLGALAFKLHQVIKSKWPRYFAVWSVVTLLLFIIISVSSICSVCSTYYESPVAYYTHNATGNRLVITKYIDRDSMNEEFSTMDDAQYVYSAHPMANKYFYFATIGENVHTNTGVDYVSWSEDGSVATVYLTNTAGEEQTITIGFSEEDIIAALEQGAGE